MGVIMKNEKVWLYRADLCRLLGISPATLRTRILAGEIPDGKPFDGKKNGWKRWHVSVVEEVLNR